jgi:hypothetical protein
VSPIRTALVLQSANRCVEHRAIPGVEHVDDSTYRRSVTTAEGRLRCSSLPPDSEEPLVWLRVRGVGEDVPLLPGLVQTARYWTLTPIL